jgi:hypothetical protein
LINLPFTPVISSPFDEKPPFQATKNVVEDFFSFNPLC